MRTCKDGVRGRARVRRAAAMMVLVAFSVGTAGARSAAPAVAHDPQPLRIPLEPLGYRSILPDFMVAGDSMLTVDFVGNDHLLVTFAVRRLMKREANDGPDDDVRTIGAVLIELPTGKVMARTEWRLHDRRQYLWNLGQGRFLLRVRDQLSVLSPLEGVKAGNAFRERQLSHIDRQIVAILVSAEHDLLTVETIQPATAPGQATGITVGGDPAPVLIDFYRLHSSGAGAEGLELTPAGSIRTHTAVALPLTTAGFLEVLDGGKNRWMFNFDELAGKVDELAEFDTSCFPVPTFIGPGEFVTFACRGSEDRVEFAGFNLKGEQMWQQNFSESQVTPTFAFAPAAGRFALGRTLVSIPVDSDFPLNASVVTGQEVRVYQSYNGAVLFKTDCSPVERAGQNFALSEDGARLAAVRETTVRHAATADYAAYVQREAAVEVYDLPPLSDADRAAVKAAQAQAPADSGARIDMALERISKAATKRSGEAIGDEPSTVPAAAPAVDEAAAAGNGNAGNAAQGSAENQAGTAGTGAPEGDVTPATPRKPPTLYGPDEKRPEQTQPKPQ